MKLKIFILALTLLMIPLMGSAADGVRLLLKNGTTVDFAFADRPVVIAGSMLTVRTNNLTVYYDYGEIQRIYFINDAVSSGIKGLNANVKSNITFCITEYGIDVYGLSKNVRVDIFTLNGTLVSSAKSESENGNVRLLLPMGQNVYIVKTSSGVKYKFIRK